VVSYLQELRTSNKLTPWSRVLLEKLTLARLVSKFHAFYGNRKKPCSQKPANFRFISKLIYNV